MTKALKSAQTALDTLRDELETWINNQPATPKPARKPAVKRTRAQLLASATAPTVVVPIVPVEDVDTSWVDLLAPVPVPSTPAPVAVPAPLYVDATDLIRIELEAPHILDFPEPQPVPARRTLRQAFRDGYDSYGK